MKEFDEVIVKGGDDILFVVADVHGEHASLFPKDGGMLCGADADNLEVVNDAVTKKS